MELSALQSKMGYQFKDENLLIQSLTHPSYMIRAEIEESSNQRLEFLGDSVLELIISDYLYLKFPDIREGQLTLFRSTLVKGSVLVELAGHLKLSGYIRVNRSTSEDSTRDLPSSREDALEAVIGAIYLDSDFSTVREVVLKWFGDIPEHLDELNEAHNPKGQLQELLQPSIGNDKICYQVINESGPSHARTFEVELFVGDRSCSKASGKSKKEAEERAAQKVLAEFDSFNFTHA
ncbi:MAG: ribonuclease III [Verrucomicrobia bacterium]|nr:ribonuclease III [Verrucomicrobiota bacterium]